MPFDPFSGFKVGQELGQGQSAFGELVRSVTERAKKMQDLGAEASVKYGLDPELRAKQEAYSHVSTSTQDPSERIKLFQQSGLLPRPQKSLEEIFAESEARSGGIRAGAPKVLSATQEDAIEGIQTTLATLDEISKFLDTNPDVQTGLLVPAFRRDFIGNVARSVSDPKLTSFSQMSFRLQDAYRRFVTGVQAGFQEVAQFLPSSLPNPSTQNVDQLREGIKTFRAETQRAAEQIKRGMRSRGYDEPSVNQMFAALPSLESFQTSANRPVGSASEATVPARGSEDVKSRLRAKYGRR